MTKYLQTCDILIKIHTVGVNCKSFLLKKSGESLDFIDVTSIRNYNKNNSVIFGIDIITIEVNLMNTLLSIANGALQYHRGRQTGIVGLMGIGLALLAVFQWKYIYPILKVLGIVDFFKRLGIVYEGEPGLTGFAIFMFIFKLTILLSIVLFLLLALAIVTSMIFSNEKIGLYIMLPIIAVLMAPLGILFFLYQAIFHRKELIENAEREKKLGTPLEQLLRDHSEEIPIEQALIRLNRIPTAGDNLFLLGVMEDKKLYMVLPRPIKFETAIYSSGDLVGLHCSVEKYIEAKHKPKSMFEVIPKLFLIKAIDGEREIIPSEQFVAFYQTSCDDMLSKFKGYSNQPVYENYVKEVQDDYFTSKQTILSNISNATEKRIFDNLVNRMSMFDASNEEIVKIMLDSEKQTQD
jgi:hypothetical protein